MTNLFATNTRTLLVSPQRIKVLSVKNCMQVLKLALRSRIFCFNISIQHYCSMYLFLSKLPCKRKYYTPFTFTVPVIKHYELRTDIDVIVMLKPFMFLRNKIQNYFCRQCFLPTTMLWVNATCPLKLQWYISIYLEDSSSLHMAYFCIVINLDGLGYLNHSDSRPSPTCPTASKSLSET